MNENEQAEVQELAAAVEQEKTLPQSKVNDLVRQEKEAARIRAQQDYEQQLADYKRQIEQLKAANPSVGGMQNNFNIEDVYNQVENRLREKIEREQREMADQEKRRQMEQVASDYYRKLDSVKDKYPDFQAVMGKFKASSFPEIVMLASQMDNAGDIMYELAKHPEKLANVWTLAKGDPELARMRLESMGNSIMQNEQAVADYQAPPAPLSRMQSTHGGVNKPAPSSVREFKDMDWLRG